MSPAVILAHGVGTRSDLPIPTTFAAVGAGLVLLVSFGVLGLLWRRPRLRGGAAGRSLPPVVTRAVDSPRLRRTLQALAALAAGLVCVVGLAGSQEIGRNLAPWAFYVNFWVGLVVASLLLGPVLRVLNPLRSVHAGLARLLRVDPTGPVALPAAVGYWPAAASLAAFAWFELVYPAGSHPRTVAAVILGYALIHTAAALVFGRGWFDRGDGFEAYSSLLGAMAPIGRRADGRLAVRNPLDGLDTVTPAPGLAGIVVVLIGSTAFDGVSRTLWWQTSVPSVGTVNRTVGLVLVVTAVAVIYLVGTWSFVLTEGFAHTLVPIAAGYAIAHYFSLLIFDGQQIAIMASDPLATGANLFGTAAWSVDYTLVGTTAIGLVQISAIVVGHVLAAVSAHDRAVLLFPHRALRTQLPLLATMVVLTMSAVGLVFAV